MCGDPAYTALQQQSKSSSSQINIRKINIMSMLAIAFPVEAAVPVAQSLIGATIAMMRPLLGLGVLVTLLMVFKPLVMGIVRAAFVMVVPRKSLEQRVRQHRFNGVKMLNRMANDYSRSQPNFAAELRNLAASDK